MTFINNLINTIGKYNIIIIALVILVIIFGFIIYKSVRLRKYRKEIIELENRMNATKTLPIQYRLGRIKGIARNMPEVKEKYEEYTKEYQTLVDEQLNSITNEINDIDEKLFSKKVGGVKSALLKLDEDIQNYEKECKELLDKIEVITEIENVQRIEIIKIKEKYRNTNDTYGSVRFKVENYVPNIKRKLDEVETEFVELEDLMNSQKYEEAKSLTNEISNQITLLDDNLRDLPTYISIVRKYIPERINELNETIKEMKENDFALERMNTSVRFNKINSDLESAIRNIKDLQLENVGQTIEVVTQEIKQLSSDFDNEQAAFKKYKKAHDNCFDTINDIDKGYKQAIESYSKIQKNYIVSEYNITLEEDKKKFEDIKQELEELNVIIKSKDFSYSSMIESFDDLVAKARISSKDLARYNELEATLILEEKRALDELDNINIVLLEIKSEIKNKHLPMINDSYKDYIKDSYEKADAILSFIKQRPIDLDQLSNQVDAARDVIYKLYDNVHNLIVTAEMVEDAIVYGNRYRSDFLEVNTELTKAELLFRNGEYTKALTTAVDIIEKIKPGSYEMLVNKSKNGRPDTNNENKLNKNS